MRRPLLLTITVAVVAFTTMSAPASAGICKPGSSDGVPFQAYAKHVPCQTARALVSGYIRAWTKAPLPSFHGWRFQVRHGLGYASLTARRHRDGRWQTVEAFLDLRGPMAVTRGGYVFGDSIVDLVGARLDAHARRDSANGRTTAQLISVLQAHTPFRRTDRVVVMIGTNGGSTTWQLRALLRLTKPARLYLTTIHGVPWQDELNTRMRTIARKLPRVRIVEWAPLVTELHDDGIHPNGYGQERLAGLWLRALR